MKKFIWLFGENLGNTFDNNSYYFWDHVCNRDDGIDKYLILAKTPASQEFYRQLDEKRKDKIVWKNSLRHLKLFKEADMYFVSLSYRDILPEKLLNKPIKLIIKRPLIYLQHGTIAIKKLGYKGDTYYNNLIRFVYYNPDIKDKLIEQNNFNEYQLYYGEFLPRYKKTVEYYLERQRQKDKQKKILFFITWREYFGDNFATYRFINKLNQIFENPKLHEYAKENNIEIELCMHQFYDDDKIAVIKELIKDTNVKLTSPNKVNLMKELATCDLLVTDYSSVSFDCTFLNIPVLLFQPDYEEYFHHRPSYYDLDIIEKYNIKKPDELVEAIIANKYKVNKFFKDRLPKRINYKAILQGKHIDRMYEYFKNLQENRITILGYNFTGKGGTVSATKSMAEALMERGYLVELLSLRMTEKKYSLPYGLACNGLYNRRQNHILNWFKRNTHRNKKNYYYFKYDINQNYLIPYVGYALKKYLENTNSRTIISTRESIHLFVHNFANSNVKNKLYFFHTDSTVLNDYYPNLINEIKKETLENCIFVTEASKNAYKNTLGYSNYDNCAVIGNCLESKSMTERSMIKINRVKKEINAVSLMRLSLDRQDDVNNIIEFGKYLVKNNITNIKIKIYGQGDLKYYFIDAILKNNIDDIIYYMGPTDNPKSVILANDCVIDFCNNQSFGMTYIESILNGRFVFAKENTGSLEVLKDIPFSYYHSNEELLMKLKDVKKIKVSEYKKNYDCIARRYSRKIVAEEIEKMLK